MATEAQIAANRRNCQQSSGPRSDAGKAASARNAFKHGMRARDVVLPGEEPTDFDELRDELRRDLQPEGKVQELLFERIAACAWRLRRAVCVERGLLQPEAELPYRHQLHYADLIADRFAQACETADALGKLSRYENSIERGMHKAMEQLCRLQDRAPRAQGEREEKNCRTKLA